MHRVDLVSQTKAWAKGRQIHNPKPELLLYIACKKFHCLPNAGGWYDQSTEVCENFMIIGNAIEEAKHEENRRNNKKNR